MRIISCQKCENRFETKSNNRKYCDDCVKLVAKEDRVKWKKENYEKWKENKRGWYQRQKSKIRKYYAKYREEHKEEINLKNRIWDKGRDKVVVSIRNETYRDFQKENVCAMIFCNNKDNLEFHHWVYKKPVERQHFSTLCLECHSLVHLKPLMPKQEMGERIVEE